MKIKGLIFHGSLDVEEKRLQIMYLKPQYLILISFAVKKGRHYVNQAG